MFSATRFDEYSNQNSQTWRVSQQKSKYFDIVIVFFFIIFFCKYLLHTANISWQDL